MSRKRRQVAIALGMVLFVRANGTWAAEEVQSNITVEVATTNLTHELQGAWVLSKSWVGFMGVEMQCALSD